MRILLWNVEWATLTNIGNGYRIRHHESGKKELTLEHRNYFFFRMLSLIDLCLAFLNNKETKNSDMENIIGASS